MSPNPLNSHFYNFSSFDAPIEQFLLPCLPDCCLFCIVWSDVNSLYCFLLLFFFHFSYCIIQFWSVLFSCFLSLCCSHSFHPFFSQIWWASLWPLLLTLYFIECLSPACLVLFLGFCVILSFRTYSFISSFCLTLCVCFSVFGKAPVFPSFESVILCRLWTVGPWFNPPGHLTQVLWGLHCVDWVFLLLWKSFNSCGYAGEWFGSQADSLGGPAATVDVLMGGLVPQSESHFGETPLLAKATHWVWRSRGHFRRVLGRVGPLGNTGARQTVLASSVESVSYGTC